MLLTIKGYKFEISYHAMPKFPHHLKNHLLLSVEHTLASIPLKTLKNNLNKGHTYLLNLSIVSKNQIKRLNSDYRNKAKATDVLSFSRLEGQKIVSAVPDIGDVIVCFEVAKKQAHVWKNSVPEELRRLTVHGILHLFGYDHELSKFEEKKMFTLQESILKKINKKYYSRIASMGSNRDARIAGNKVAIKIKRDATK